MTLKRTFDIAASLLLAVPATPIVLSLAFASAVVHKQPAFFSQQRVGRDGEIFTIYKVRSMRDEFNEKGQALPDEKRVTDFGRFIRRFRIDELPQLWNVLKGDMSIVGPRPHSLIRDQNVIFDEIRTRVRPGFFGLAQINGHDTLSYPERLKFDQQYVLDQEKNDPITNFIQDLKIIASTPAAAKKFKLMS